MAFFRSGGIRIAAVLLGALGLIAAAVGLAALDRSEGLDLLHEGLSAADTWLRWEAIHSLGSVHDESTPARLAALLRDAPESERIEAVQSLGKIGGAAAHLILLGALEDPAPGVRLRACRWAGLSGREDARRALTELLLRETDANVKRQAQSALEKLDARR